MTGQTTYNEASEVPFPDVVNRYQALDNRDAIARAIATLQARGEWNEDRSLNPEDYPALTARRAPRADRARRGDGPALPPPGAGP